MAALLTFEPDETTELEDHDGAFLWALRCVAAGRLDCPSLRRAFVDLCGPAADPLLCGLLVFVRLLAVRCPGGLRLHLPGSSAISRDERAILAALAGLREEGRAETPALLAAELTERLGVGTDRGVTAAFLHLADLLAARAPAPASRRPERTIVH